MQKDTSTKSAKKWDKKKLARYAGTLLMLLAFVFIAYKISRYNIDFSLLASPVTVLALLGLAVLWGISVFSASFNYSWLLDTLTGKKAGRALVVATYCRSNLYKYLPGNVMHFVGRNQLAIDVDELTHAEVAFVTITENIFLILSAAIISLVSTFDYFISYFRQMVIPGYVFAIIGGLALVCAVLAVIFRKKLARWLRRYVDILKQLTPKTVLRLLFFCTLRLLALAVTYLCTLLLFGQAFSWDLVPQVLGLNVLSWLIGYITPGAPGGLGVREAIMLMFMGDAISESLLLTTTLMHRVICIVGDVFAYLFALGYCALAKRRRQQ